LVGESTPPSLKWVEAPRRQEQEGAPEPPRSGVEGDPITISDGSGGDGPSKDASPMDEEVEASPVAKWTPWPIGLHSVEEQRKRGEEERERETLQHLQEGQQQPQQEGEEGEEGRRPEGAQLEELLEQDRQQELLELQEYQKQRSQQLEALLEPPPRSLAQPEPPTNKSLRSGRRVCLSMVRRP